MVLAGCRKIAWRRFYLYRIRGIYGIQNSSECWYQKIRSVNDIWKYLGLLGVFLTSWRDLGNY